MRLVLFNYYQYKIESFLNEVNEISTYFDDKLSQFGDKMRVTLAVTAIFTIILVCSVNAGDNKKAFPPPDQRQIRYVINLADIDDESNYQVELIVGQTVEIMKSIITL